MASSKSSHHFGWENSIYHNVIAINVKHHRPLMIDDGCCFGFGVDFFCNSKTTLLVNISSITERSQLPKYPIHIIMLQQCILLGLERSSFYYKPVGESEFNLMIMRIMDEIHLDYPYLLRGLDIVRPNQVWEMDITGGGSVGSMWPASELVKPHVRLQFDPKEKEIFPE